MTPRKVDRILPEMVGMEVCNKHWIDNSWHKILAVQDEYFWSIDRYKNHPTLRCEDDWIIRTPEEKEKRPSVRIREIFDPRSTTIASMPAMSNWERCIVQWLDEHWEKSRK